MPSRHSHISRRTWFFISKCCDETSTKKCFLHFASTSEDAICKATLFFQRGEEVGRGRHDSQDLETRTQQEMRFVMNNPSLVPDDCPWDGKPVPAHAPEGLDNWTKTLGLISAALNF